MPNERQEQQCRDATGDPRLGPGNTSLDPNTKQLTITGATVLLDPLSAITLNTVFPNASGDPSNDFAPGDPLGTISASATLR